MAQYFRTVGVVLGTLVISMTVVGLYLLTRPGRRSLGVGLLLGAVAGVVVYFVSREVHTP
jgi:hypothetical protein